MNSYNKKINFKKFPDRNGRFGKYGGRFVAETLMPLLLDLEQEYKYAKKVISIRKKFFLTARAGADLPTATVYYFSQNNKI